MPKVKISKNAAYEAKRLSEEAYQELCDNTVKLERERDILFSGVNDPAATKTFDLMFEELRTFLHNLGTDFAQIEQFADDTIRWVDEHTESWRR